MKKCIKCGRGSNRVMMLGDKCDDCFWGIGRESGHKIKECRCSGCGKVQDGDNSVVRRKGRRRYDYLCNECKSKRYKKRNGIKG